MSKRLDIYLVEHHYFKSRNLAQRAIKNEKVKVNDKIVTNKNYQVKENDEIELINDELSFVSRGGYKLYKALNYFNIDVSNYICLDIGASTGGFSDCLLKHSAKKVYALDVGSNQLDESLRNDPRIISMEQTNFRYLNPNTLKDKIDLCVIDVSFISLYHIFEVLSTFKEENLEVITLIKPQFETIRKNLNKHGVVKDKDVHYQILDHVCGFIKEFGFHLIDITFSPIQGEKSGNIEYLGYFNRNIETKKVDFKKVVDEAYLNFKVGK